MKFRNTLGAAIILSMTFTQATPTYIYQGACSITNYPAKGIPVNTPNAHLWQDKNWTAMTMYATGSTLSRAWDARDNNCTDVALTNGTASTEWVFLPILGKGISGSNNHYTFSSVLKRTIPYKAYGNGDERWVVTLDNNLLSGVNIATFDPIFRGLQAWMGFRTVNNVGTMWSSNTVPETLTGPLWRNWTINNATLWNAWKAAGNYMASNAGVQANITLVTGRSPATNNNFSNYTYAMANRDRGYNWAAAILTYNNF